MWKSLFARVESRRRSLDTTILCVSTIAAALFLSVQEAAAQVPRIEVVPSYQLLRSQGQTFTIGWNVSAVVNVGSSFGIVADFGEVRRTDATSLFSLTTRIANLGLGARMNVRTRRTVVYAQVSAGIVQVRGRAVFDDVNVSGMRQRSMFQPGVGVIVPIGRRFGVSGELSYRHVFLRQAEDGAKATDDLRALIGARIAF
jgi:hypothetical protein